MGAYLLATNMWSLPIVRKYNMHANVLANFKYYNRYVATAYCSGYLKYAHKLWRHMRRFYIGHVEVSGRKADSRHFGTIKTSGQTMLGR